MSELLGAVFSLAFVAQMVKIAVPYGLAAICGALTERAGVIDLALEAKLLFGAFTAAAVSHATGSAYVGLVAAMAAGVAVAAVQLACSLGFRANQVIVGVALNVLALGGTRFLLQLIYGEGANSPHCEGVPTSVLGNPIVWLAVIAAIVVPLAVTRTRWGLRLRAAGDRPEALVAVGASPMRARFAAALVGGALAGAGGAQLSLAVNGFSADMSSGRGYIAVAMVMLAGWRPGWAVVASLLVAAAEALRILFQVTAIAIPPDLAPLFPYVVTIVVTAVAGSRQPPRALGRVE